jgi:hypothetical protein
MRPIPPIPVAVAKGFTSDAGRTGRPPAGGHRRSDEARGSAPSDERSTSVGPATSVVSGPGAAVDTEQDGEVNDFTVRVE